MADIERTCTYTVGDPDDSDAERDRMVTSLVAESMHLPKRIRRLGHADLRIAVAEQLNEWAIAMGWSVVPEPGVR